MLDRSESVVRLTLAEPSKATKSATLLRIQVGRGWFATGAATTRLRCAILLYEIETLPWAQALDYATLFPRLARYPAWSDITDERQLAKGREQLDRDSVEKTFAKYMRALEQKGLFRRSQEDPERRRQIPEWTRACAIVVDTEAALHLSALRSGASTADVTAPIPPAPLMGDAGVQLYLTSVGTRIDRVHIDGAIDIDSSRAGWAESEVAEVIAGPVSRPSFQPWIDAWKGSTLNRGKSWEKYCVLEYTPPPTADHERFGPRFRLGVSDWDHIQGQRYANGVEPDPEMRGRRFSEDGRFVGNGGARYGLEFHARGADPRTVTLADERVLYATCSHVIVESSDKQLMLFRRGMRRQSGTAPVAFAAEAWSATIEEQPRDIDLPERCDVRVGHPTSLFFNAALRGLGEELLDYDPEEASFRARGDTASIVMLSAFFEPAPWYINLLFLARMNLTAQQVAARWRATEERAEGVSLWWGASTGELLGALLAGGEFDPDQTGGELRSRELVTVNRGAWHPSARFRLWCYARANRFDVPTPQ